MYIYQNENWPHFYWDNDKITNLLATVDFARGQLLGKMQHIGFDLKQEALLETLALEITKSSEIEGEIFNMQQVRSSIANKLNIKQSDTYPHTHHIDGIVDMMLDATNKYTDKLTRKRLFSWHAALFPTGYSGMYKIKVAQLRDDENGPMQVVSNKNGREIVYFQAPSAPDLATLLPPFLQWINKKNQNHALINAAIAHLWFITLHPFDDGNGRIARAITEMMLARADDLAYRFYSVSTQIQKDKKNYYLILEHTQKNSLDITRFLDWFLHIILKAIKESDKILAKIIKKANLWQTYNKIPLDKNQIKLINMLLDDFTGHLTTTKWAKICKTSPDTALRSITYLLNHQILEKQGTAKTTHYTLKNPD